MEHGLHIGLAAWAHRQRSAPDSFVAWPPQPVPITLTAFGLPQSMEDLSRAWEFAHLTNGDVRRGHTCGVSSEAPLWTRHRNLLAQMEFARRPWTESESLEFQQARSVLFTTHEDGVPRISPPFAIYEEYRRAVADLEQAGTGAGDIVALTAEWLAIGHKVEVQAALATMTRLSERSSQPQAESDRLTLHPDLLLSAAQGSYAATSVTPLSAVDMTTWLERQVTLADLDDAVGDASPREHWDSWRGTKVGVVTFRFVTVLLHRSWFTASLYAKRDWRLHDSRIVSAADGVEGELPAYAECAYLVAVEDVAVRGRDAGDRDRPVVRPVPLRPPAGFRPAPVWPLAAAAPTTSPVVSSSAVSMSRVGVQVPRPGAATATPAPDLRPTGVRVHSLPYVARKPVALDLYTTHRRILFTQAMFAPGANREPVSSAAPSTGSAFLVGLGCAPIPTSPQPDPRYQWAS